MPMTEVGGYLRAECPFCHRWERIVKSCADNASRKKWQAEYMRHLKEVPHRNE
jgi:hypothetical protein